MGKKMKFPFLFRATEPTTSTTASPWPWPACVNNPKTLSFRATPDNIYKTMNSAYLHEKPPDIAETSTRSSYFSTSQHHHDQEPFSILDEPEPEPDTALILDSLRSDRLFFEPGETSSILEEAKAHVVFPYKDNVEIMAMDSKDPFLDFRVSMEEMVEAHGLKDWECLEELLTCYLKVNGKSNHGYIVGAFVDLLMNLALTSDNDDGVRDISHMGYTMDLNGSGGVDDEPCSSSSTTATHSFTSPLSFDSSTTYTSTSPCLSMQENDDEIVVEKIVEVSSSSLMSSCNASTNLGHDA